MFKKLFLIRHAEAAPAEGMQKDIDRTLTATGFRDATHLGQYLQKKDVIADHFLSSPAVRTSQTSEEIAVQIRYEVRKINYRKNLYEPSVRELLAELNGISDGNTCLLVSHNPSVSYLAEYLSGEPVAYMNPGGCLEIDFSVEDWAEISQGSGQLVNVFTPE